MENYIESNEKNNVDRKTENQSENEFLQIGQFAKRVGLTASTIDLWFKRMEEKLIHYVQREETSDRKIYNKLDYDIACFIRDLRDKDKQEVLFPLDAIFEMVPSQFKVRPFPPDKEKSSDINVFDVEAVRRRFTQAAKEEMEVEGQKIISKIETMLSVHFHGIQNLVQEQAASLESTLKIESDQATEGIHNLKEMKEMLEIQAKLLELTTKVETEAEKAQRLALEEENRKEQLRKEENEKKKQIIQERDNYIIREATKKRIESKLRAQALEKWINKDEGEKYIKNGWFGRREENISKRDKFVEEYIAENFETEYRKQFIE